VDLLTDMMLLLWHFVQCFRIVSLFCGMLLCHNYDYKEIHNEKTYVVHFCSVPCSVCWLLITVLWYKMMKNDNDKKQGRIEKMVWGGAHWT